MARRITSTSLVTPAKAGAPIIGLSMLLFRISVFTGMTEQTIGHRLPTQFT
ncbi:MAG: hypothetical protein OJF51_000868 [Nitrospira sp.]|nr:MAG: hypothetical protein OJF51_000868 [Nitrospira sp.]